MDVEPSKLAEPVENPLGGPTKNSVAGQWHLGRSRYGRRPPRIAT